MLVTLSGVLGVLVNIVLMTHESLFANTPT